MVSPGRLTIERYRDLLGEFPPAIAGRIRVEGRLAADQSPDDELSPLRPERLQRALADDFQQSTAAADAAHAATSQTHDDEFQSAVAHLRAEYCRAVGEIDARFDA